MNILQTLDDYATLRIAAAKVVDAYGAGDLAGITVEQDPMWYEHAPTIIEGVYRWDDDLVHIAVVQYTNSFPLYCLFYLKTEQFAPFVESVEV